MIRIPDDAFEQYVAMGPLRSYRGLADKLHVTKRAVSKCAHREDWAGRLAKIDQASRERSDERIAETLDETRTRHLRSLKAVQGRAIEALKKFPLNSANEAVSALEKAIRLERLILGEPSERGELAVAEITRRELDTLLVSEDEDDDDDEAEVDGEPEAAAG
jgi:hypothetical protein